MIQVNKPHLHYITDTARGSSDAPVFNDDWQVIALHHAYGGMRRDTYGNNRQVNQGILINAIREHAAEKWPL